VSLAVWVGVLVIGGLGAVLRFLVDVTLSARLGRSFPYGTLAVNLSGSAVLGLLTGLALGREEALLAGDGSGRLVHDVLDVDVRVPAPRRGPPGPLPDGEPRGEPGGRRGRRGGRMVDRGPAVIGVEP
jgi:hypothetical protein